MSLDVILLQETFKRAAEENGGAKALGLRFYERLFEKYPQVRPLFNTPPEEQHKKLIASVGAIVAGVTRLETLLPYLHAMGIRHLKYQTEEGHYGAVAENLVAVLEEHLSVEGEFTEAMRATWIAAIDTINKVMIEAANNPEDYVDEMSANGYQADGFRANDPEPWLVRH